MPLSEQDLQPLGSTFKPPSATYIARLEAETQHMLPPDYRVFLGKYGVCACAEYTSFAPSGGPRVDLNVFLGSDPDDSYDLIETYRGLKDRLPDGLLPFAFDPFGNAVCIDLGDNSYGRIYLWDHETESVVFVAKTFHTFLVMLAREP
ncbi:MAG: SMI1/KNR4 family protein [Deltaproteobacteria bacterium]|nr:MAG: SMI1/KNR4 family protein [Deltaproteobacteria bacterium]